MRGAFEIAVIETFDAGETHPAKNIVVYHLFGVWIDGAMRLYLKFLSN